MEEYLKETDSSIYSKGFGLIVIIDLWFNWNLLCIFYIINHR